MRLALTWRNGTRKSAANGSLAVKQKAVGFCDGLSGWIGMNVSGGVVSMTHTKTAGLGSMLPVGLIVATYLLFIIAQASAWLGGHDFVHHTEFPSLVRREPSSREDERRRA